MSTTRSMARPEPTDPVIAPAPPGAEQALAGSRRVLFAAASGTALAARHVRLIADLIARRHRVLCLAPLMTDTDAAALTAAGAEVRPWPSRESFLRALAERHEAGSLKAIIADWQPHVALVHGDTAALPALVAARAARVPRVLALVDGLATLEAGSRPDLKRWRRALDGVHAVVVASQDDARTLAQANLIGAGLAARHVAGGVDLESHRQQPLPGLGDGLVFAMVATLDQRHGVNEFLAAAAWLAAQAPSARFLLGGPLPTHGGVPAEAIKAQAGIVQYLGPVDDIRPVLARCHVFVYPTHEGGVPTPVLAALAAGRPVITTDAPGCRDTVDERVNGCLVPPRNANALADAMASFLRRPDLIPSMARAARVKAERRFDERVTTSRLADIMGLG